MTIHKLVRPHLLGLKPYSSARDDFKGSAEVYLDANENPFGSVPTGAFNRYPDPRQNKVKTLLSEIKGVPPEQIFLGNGSDEAIDLLIRAFCEPEKDEIIIMPPTYGMYQVCADINLVRARAVPLKQDFQPDLDGLRDHISSNSKLIFICSPNNPSGNLINRDIILELTKDFNGLVVVDEAYIDFTGKDSLTQELGKFSNLVILQTFSKAWGLAAIRLGIAFGSRELIQVMNRIKPPYNISGPTQQLALNALEEIDKKNTLALKIISERRRLQEELRSLQPVDKVFPSDANFLLVRFSDAEKTDQYLKLQGIVTRNRSREQQCDNCLRITIGKPEENDRLIEALKTMP